MKTKVTVLSVSQWRPTAYDYYDVRVRIPSRPGVEANEKGRDFFQQSFIQIRCCRTMFSPFDIVLTSSEYDEMGRPTVGDILELDVKKPK